jgi:hypothetical protein
LVGAEDGENTGQKIFEKSLNLSGAEASENMLFEISLFV